MADTRDVRSVIEAAEQAAGTGDYASAEQLLREAAALQEATLGPQHPDLANTLNNLGIVCEITEKPADAELFFRRAYAIATAVLAPDHPFVATSRQNLEDFCRSRGLVVDPPAPMPDVAAEAVVVPEQIVAPDPVVLPQPVVVPEPTRIAEPREEIRAAVVRAEEPSSPYDSSEPAASRGLFGPLGIAALVAAALIVIFVASRWFRTSDVTQSSVATAPAPAPTATEPPPAATSKPVEPPPAVAAPVAESASMPAPPKPVGADAAVAEKPSATAGRRGNDRSTAERPVASAAQPTVVEADICRTLSTGRSSNWGCVAPTQPLAPGSLFFYTRITSPKDTIVEHRWYRGDELRQTVELRIPANGGEGYRTYSRRTVDGQGGGDWRVELRTKDGVVLHEERFAVR